MWHHDFCLHLHVNNKGESLSGVEARGGTVIVACACMLTRDGIFVVLRQEVAL